MIDITECPPTPILNKIVTVLRRVKNGTLCDTLWCLLWSTMNLIMWEYRTCTDCRLIALHLLSYISTLYLYQTSDFSEKIFLSISAAPQLLKPTGGQAQFSWVVGGQFACVALRGNPEPTFQWRFQLCFPGGSCSMWKDAQLSPFFLINTRKSHSTLIIQKKSHVSGMFKLRCIGSNSSGNDQRDYLVFN